ncbi:MULTISPECIES: hypothetical protein, partial [unclassified Frankia]|uniref:hypothetical protein n=1 Tax=unclassified Frankia TaxID=2632575 RepID=UPI002AD3FB0A
QSVAVRDRCNYVQARRQEPVAEVRITLVDVTTVGGRTTIGELLERSSQPRADIAGTGLGCDQRLAVPPN